MLKSMALELTGRRSGSGGLISAHSQVAHAVPALRAAQQRPAAGCVLLSNARGTDVEDTYVLCEDVSGRGSGAMGDSQPPHHAPLPLVGVFDGHGGGAASAHCRRRLHHHVAAHLRCHASHAPRGDDAAGAPGDDPGEAVGRALSAAFVATDAELRHQPHAQSGSTAVVAVLAPSSIWVAWAGDSRAVLVRGQRAAAATADHRPEERADEKERIERAGGMLLNNGGLRLMGVLATTRAIGDHDLRDYGLTPEPEVMRLPRSPEDEFLVLASDGLWDRVTPDEAAAFVHSAWGRVTAACGQGAPDTAAAPNAADGRGGGALAPQSSGQTCPACKAARVAAAAMTRCARARRSRDDATVVVVNLKHPCRCAGPIWAGAAVAAAGGPELVAASGSGSGSGSGGTDTPPPSSPTATAAAAPAAAPAPTLAPAPAPARQLSPARPVVWTLPAAALEQAALPCEDLTAGSPFFALSVAQAAVGGSCFATAGGGGLLASAPQSSGVSPAASVGRAASRGSDGCGSGLHGSAGGSAGSGAHASGGAAALQELARQLSLSLSIASAAGPDEPQPPQGLGQWWSLVDPPRGGPGGGPTGSGALAEAAACGHLSSRV